jgi:WD40-like Beta Propeller Repeat
MRLPTTCAIKMLSGTATALAVSAALAMPAGAHSGGTATGAFTFLSDTKTPIGQAGGDVFIHEVASISYTGGLPGSLTPPTRSSPTATGRSPATGSKPVTHARSAAEPGRSRRCSRSTDLPQVSPGGRSSSVHQVDSRGCTAAVRSKAARPGIRIRMTIDSHRPVRAGNTMRTCVLLVAGVATFAVGLVGSASATFPGSNGPIVFRDDHPSSGTGSPLFRARADGSQVRVFSKRPGLFSDWRPDGGRIAFDFFQRDGSEQIATMRRDGSDLNVITSGKGIHEVPSYSPDGRSLVFDASREDPSSPSFQTRLWVMRADGSRAHRLAMANSGFDDEPRYAPNGRWIAFNRIRSTPHGQLLAAFVVSTTGKHGVHRLTPWSLGAEHPTWSPDSRWIL